MQKRNLRFAMLAVVLTASTLISRAQNCLICPQPVTVEAGANCVATVTYAVPTNCGPVTSSHPSGSTFPMGTTNVTLTAGNSTCMFTVTVVDTQAPNLSDPSATPNSMWPPNHKFWDIAVNYTVSDNCPYSCALQVESNEPVNDIGDGNTAPDWIILSNTKVKLRAERAGPLTGRIYTISVTCTDQTGNAVVKKTTVTVPHDMGKRKSERDPNSLALAEGFSVKVLSNPTRNYFTLNVASANTTDRLAIRVLDISGKLVESRNNILPNQTLTVGNNYRPGIYFIELRQGVESKKLRVVKSE